MLINPLVDIYGSISLAGQDNKPLVCLENVCTVLVPGCVELNSIYKLKLTILMVVPSNRLDHKAFRAVSCSAQYIELLKHTLLEEIKVVDFICSVRDRLVANVEALLKIHVENFA